MAPHPQVFMHRVLPLCLAAPVMVGVSHLDDCVWFGHFWHCIVITTASLSPSLPHLTENIWYGVGGQHLYLGRFVMLSESEYE